DARPQEVTTIPTIPLSAGHPLRRVCRSRPARPAGRDPHTTPEDVTHPVTHGKQCLRAGQRATPMPCLHRDQRRRPYRPTRPMPLPCPTSGLTRAATPEQGGGPRLCHHQHVDSRLNQRSLLRRDLMFRIIIDLALLAVAATLVIIGIASYPAIPVGVLAALVAAAALLLAPVGTREVSP